MQELVKHMATTDTLEQAAAILRAVWEGINPDYKAKYRMTIWEQFQSRIAAQARMTNDLSTLLSRLSSTFDQAIIGPYRSDQRQYVADQLHLPVPQQRALVAAMREHAPVIVLLLRTWLQEEKEVNAND